LPKNRKCEVTCPHFMERSASVANIKCVNSNLLGIWNFILPHIAGFLGIYDFRLLHYSLIAEDATRVVGPIAKNCGRYQVHHRERIPIS
jgi:hypothetical protein